MFIKSLAATATAVIASLTIAPFAEAGLNHKAIANKLNTIGVTTAYGDCGSSEHGHRLGSYNFVNNHFCISDTIPTSQLFNETVTHELVHVIQDCINGGIASNHVGSITRWLSEGDVTKENSMDENLMALLRKADKVDHVHEWTNHMHSDHKWVEIEAYALENSPLFVIQMLDNCRVS